MGDLYDQDDESQDLTAQERRMMDEFHLSRYNDEVVWFLLAALDSWPKPELRLLETFIEQPELGQGPAF